MALKTLYGLRGLLESSRGNGGTPTRLLYVDEATHDQTVETIRPGEMRNSYSPSFRAYPGMERNTIRLAGDFQFDQQAFWLNLVLKAVGSGSGGGADKLYAFEPTLTTDDLKSASIQFGYNDGIGASNPAWQLNYLLCNEYTLTFAKDVAVRWSGEFWSPSAATQISAFTGALSDTTQVTALGTGTAVFIDTTTLGSTADTNIISAEWTYRNNLVRLETLNATNVGLSLLRPNPRDWTLTLNRYYANDTERDIYLTKAIRKIRLRSTGPALGGSFYRIDVDLYGVIDNISWTEVDGLGVETLTVLPLYDATEANDLAVNLTNSLGTIT